MRIIEKTRDFTFIEDVVQANILAAESNATGVFNIAGGKHISINDLFHSITVITEKDIEPMYNDPRPGDIVHSLADISKAREQFQFNPKFTMDNGLKATAKWFRK